MKNSPANLRFHKNSRESGIALVTVLIMLVLVATLVSVTSLLAIGNRRSSTDNVLTVRAQNAAEAGVDNAINEIFYETQKAWKGSADATQVNTTDPVPVFDSCSYKKWLTGIWDYAGTTTTVVQKNDMAVAKNNNEACQYDILKKTASVPTPKFATLLNDNTERMYPTSLNKNIDATNGVSYEVTVRRQDDAATGQVNIYVKSTGYIKSGTQILAQRQVSQVFRLNTQRFDGDKFALLTNDVNCSFCHLQVDGMRRVYSKANSGLDFERVRMGVLSELSIQDSGHNADSIVAGTIYVRPNVAPGSSNSGALSAKWVTGKDGQVSVGSNASIVDQQFIKTIASTNADTGKTADISKKRLYHNYPTAARVEKEFGGKWPDGPLPDSFPAVIPEQKIGTESDINGIIEQSEWLSYIKTAPQGTLKSNTSGAAKIFGVKRPSSSATGGIGAVGTDIKISYDPGYENNQATTPLTATNRTTLRTDLDTLLKNWNATTATDFATKWKGWLIQQALASPNNRSYRAYSAIRDTSGTADGTKDLEYSVDTSDLVTARNNFYVRFDPNAKTLRLRFADKSGTNRDLTVPIAQTDIFPSTSNSAAQDLDGGANSSKSGYFNGNLIIDAGRLSSNATESVDKSINISGTIHVNGDLVIRGVVTGSGRIIARGNIYVVGDLVYGCPNTSPATGIRPCKVEEYANPDSLPRLALMAGGNILIGDYAHPDFRSNQSQFDLRNDFWRINNGQSIFEQAPGSTGRFSSGCNGGSGFVRSLAAKANRGKDPLNGATIPGDGSKYYQESPFGFIDTQNGCGGLTYLSSFTNAALIPLFPSNGPLLPGDKSSVNAANPGTTYGTQLASGLGCSNTYLNNFTDSSSNTTNFTFGYWCPPNTGSYLRTDDTSGTDPGSSAAAWSSVHAMNTRIESTSAGRGPSTGWLGGVIGYDSAKFTQLGDLSQVKILKMMWLMTMDDGQRDADPNESYTTETATTTGFGPLRTDGLLYTKNGIYGVARYYADRRGGSVTTGGYDGAISSTQSRWIHNGSVIASNLGFLITGFVENSSATFTQTKTNDADKPAVDFRPAPIADSTGSNQLGPAMGIFYDERLSGFLGINNDQPLQVKRFGGFASGEIK
jgi:Tfp pilus assembly protein PilX